ncbi:MAG: hypothetical protein OEL87_03315 [Nanoarchaeota archaeon]|nr:hypothetical protein [Nanoarchaeota archaeon]
MEFEDNFEKAMVMLQDLEQKLLRKVNNKKSIEIHISGKKNSHLHFAIETSVVNRLKNEASCENISLSELCRRKLREDPREDLILRKLDIIIKKI